MAMQQPAPENENEHHAGVARLEYELAHLVQAMDQLNAALAQLRQVLRRSDVRMQLAVESGTPHADDRLPHMN